MDTRSSAATPADLRTSVAEAASATEPQSPRTSPPTESLIPEDFDPDFRREDQDRNLWALYYQIVVGFPEDSLPVKTSVGLDALLKDPEVNPGKRALDALQRQELAVSLKPLRKEIRELKRRWGYEWRAALIRKLKSEDYHTISQGESASRLREHHEGHAIMTVISGPRPGTNRVLFVDPNQHAGLLPVHTRLLTLDKMRKSLVADYIAWLEQDASEGR